MGRSASGRRADVGRTGSDRSPNPDRPSARRQVVGWWQLTTVYAFLIAVLSVIPTKAGPPIPFLDKCLHLCEYLLLAWCIVQAARASGFPLPKIRAVAWLLSVGWGAMLEGVQSFLPYRQAEWLDVIANAIGSGLGVWLGLVKSRPRSTDHSPR